MVIVARKGGCWRCYQGQLVKFWNNDLLIIVGGEKNGCPYPTCRFNCTSASFTRGSPLKLLTIETRNHPESNWECHHAACSIQDKVCQTGAKAWHALCPMQLVLHAPNNTAGSKSTRASSSNRPHVVDSPCGWIDGCCLLARFCYGGLFFIFLSWFPLGGSWWLLVAPGGFCGFCGFCGFYGFYGSWLLWFIYHPSINLSVKHVHQVHVVRYIRYTSMYSIFIPISISISIFISIPIYIYIHLILLINTYLYLSMSIYV